jgi:hypothetical protein
LKRAIIIAHKDISNISSTAEGGWLHISVRRERGRDEMQGRL